MRTKAIALLLPLFAATVWSTETLACSYPNNQPANGVIRQMAERAFRDATTVIDGEVISPMLFPYPQGTMPVACVKVLHTWKGRTRMGVAAIAAYTSCDVPLMLKGQKVRLLLSGIGVFTADAFNNGAATGAAINSIGMWID